MTNISLHLGSANAEEARAFLVAFQQTRDMGLPAQITKLPTVEMMGIGWEITTPSMRPDRAVAMVDRLRAVFGETTPAADRPEATP